MSYPTYIGELYFDYDSQAENTEPQTKILAYFLCRLALDISRKLKQHKKSDGTNISNEFIIEGDQTCEQDLESADTLSTCKKCPLSRHKICKPLTGIVMNSVQTHVKFKTIQLPNPIFLLAGLIGYSQVGKFSKVTPISEINPDYI